MEFLRLPPNVRQQALEVLQHPDAVLRLGRDEYGVLGPSTGNRLHRVWLRQDGLWRCDSDSTANQDAPCIHLIVAFVRLQFIELPNTAPLVQRKGRDRASERRAWRRMAKRFPEVLEDLLRVGVPAIQTAPPQDVLAEGKGGRPRWSLEALVHQGVLRVWHRVNLEASQGLPNPWGACSASTLGKFHAKPESVRTVEMLLALSTWPVREIEHILHPDGTGLSMQHFRAYYDEKYRRGKKKPKKRSLLAVPKDAVLSPLDLRRRAREIEAEAKRVAAALEKPRLHTWAYAEFLWGYASTMICALHFQDSPFGEAPRFLPLLERARFMLDVEEIGGDKAYDANYIFHYAAAHGIEATVKIRDTGIPKRSNEKKKYRKAAMLESLMDAEGHEAKANRRNNAETGNSAFKARLGDEVFSKGRRRKGRRDATSLLVEVYCMAIAWNVMRLVHMEERHGVKLDFTEGAQRLRERPWLSLDAIAGTLRKKFPPSTDGGMREQWKQPT